MLLSRNQQQALAKSSKTNRFVVTESGLRSFLREMIHSSLPISRKHAKENSSDSKLQREKSVRVFDRTNLEIKPAVRANAGDMVKGDPLSPSSPKNKPDPYSKLLFKRKNSIDKITRFQLQKSLAEGKFENKKVA